MKNLSIIFAFILSLYFSLMPIPASAEKITTSHGFSLYTDLKYGPDFGHFDYVNPAAPKGGTLVQVIQNFDNLNNYAGGTTSTGAFLTGGIAETLFTPSFDEPMTVYGLIAETVTYPEDNSWVEIKIRDIARWHDGRPITVDDVLYSYELLTTKAAPSFRSIYSEAKSAEKSGPYTVKVAFSRGGDRNLIWRFIGMFPVFPKHYWEIRNFEKPTLEVPLMSGPYRISKLDIGNSVTQERVNDYWGKDLPVNKGRYNFDVIRSDVYRDLAISYEAFMAGNLDIQYEGDLSRWISGYNNDAVRNGYIKKIEFVPEGSVMFLGIGINQRRVKFKDQRVREALAYAFDWEWINKTIYYGRYKRTTSYFENTELANQGIPNGAELKLLEPFRKQLDPRIFTQPFTLPKTDATQAGLRKNLRQASVLLKEAGWSIKNSKLFNKKGEQFTINVLLAAPSQEPMFAPFIKNLKLLGIDVKMMIMDSMSFWPKYWSYDWDLVQNGLFPHSMSPGVELRDNWGSASADMSPSFNAQGIKNPVIDALIENVIKAKDRPSKLTACRALDRVICWNYYSIPLYYFNTGMMAYWDRFGFPKNLPKWTRNAAIDTLWIDKDKDDKIRKAYRSGR